MVVPHSGARSPRCLTRLPSLCPALQRLELPHQQRDVLQQVAVGQQQLPHPGLRLDARRRLRRQLVLEQLHLRAGRGCGAGAFPGSPGAFPRSPPVPPVPPLPFCPAALRGALAPPGGLAALRPKRGTGALGRGRRGSAEWGGRGLVPTPRWEYPWFVGLVVCRDSATQRRGLPCITSPAGPCRERNRAGAPQGKAGCVPEPPPPVSAAAAGGAAAGAAEGSAGTPVG